MNAKSEFLKLDANGRKLAVFAIVIVAALAILALPPMPSLSHLLAGTAHTAAAKPSPFDGRANQTAGSTVPRPESSAMFGTWQGQATLRERGVCTLKLELRPGLQNRFAGFESLLCIDLSPYMVGARPSYRATALAALDRSNAVESILSGTWDSGSIRFQVEKTTGGKQPGACALNSFSVTPFGTSQVISEWQDGACGGGQLTLKKVGM